MDLEHIHFRKFRLEILQASINALVFQFAFYCADRSVVLQDNEIHLPPVDIPKVFQFDIPAVIVLLKMHPLE